MKTFLTLVILSIAINCFGQTFDLKDFVETSTPKPWSKDWYSINTSQKYFTVEISKSKLILKAWSPKPTPEYLSPDGLFWAINAGEFGGVLDYMPNDTTIKYITVNGKADTLKDYSRKHFAMTGSGANWARQRLKKNKQFELQWGNVNEFFKYKDSIYFTEGLAHMGMKEGSVYKLDFKREGGTITNVVNLHDNPEAILVNHSKVFIATIGKFYVFNKWKKILEIDDLFWQFPNSIAMTDKRTVYVGNTGGYTKIDLKTKKVTFFRYSKLNNN